MKWNVGDRPWLVYMGTTETTKQCPICAGTKKVELILGTGEHITLDCGYCGHGWEGPLGYIIEWEFSAGAQQVTIERINSEKSFDEEKCSYHFSGSRYGHDEDIFSTEAEALEACRVRVEKREEEERTRAEYLKKDRNKSYAWNAGYHLREAKKAEESAMYHRGKAVLCKAKVKEDVK